MNTSEHLTEFAGAMVKARASMKNAALNKVNPHFKSRFADLPCTIDTVMPALVANGIVPTQTLDVLDGRTCLVTRLLHTSGQWIESVCPLPETPDMQKMGSAITYARRYSLSAICGIAADEDDDANDAVASSNGKVAQPPQKPPKYDDWLEDLAASEDRYLRKAFQDSQADFREYLTRHEPAKYAALKKRADDFDSQKQRARA